jgi:LacI family transcriptional regulator
MPKTPTIRDVASHAGVSVGTVSKCLAGTQRFSEQVEDRIDKAVRALGYRARRRTRRQAVPKPKAIAFIVRTIQPQALETIKGINRIALAAGYALHLFDKGPRLSAYERKQFDDLCRRVDGFIVSSRAPVEHVVQIVSLQKPVVFIGRGGAFPDFPSVGSDGYRGARMLGELLLGQGHQCLAYLGISKSPWNSERYAGLLHCAQAHGMSALQFDSDGYAIEESDAAISQLLQAPNRPDGIVCYNDMLAIGVMKALSARGIHVPRDISVVGFDNIVLGQYTTPPLTTIDTKRETAGELAAQLLFRQLNERAQRVDGHTLLDPELVLRGSTAARQ